MELAGLGIGIVGLAGLFNTCLDIVARIDSYKEADFDAKFLSTQFESDKIILRQWGQQVGLAGDPSGQNNPSKKFDDPNVQAVVHKTLELITRIDSEAGIDLQDSLQSSDPTGPKSMPNAPDRTKRRLTESLKIQGSRSSRVTWSLKNKTKYANKVQAFGVLVRQLFQLIPIGETKNEKHSTLAVRDGYCLRYATVLLIPRYLRFI